MKRFLTLLLLLALAVMVVACGDSEDKTEAKDATPDTSADAGSPADGPTVSIFVPSQGAILSAGDIEVKFGAEGVEIVPPGDQAAEGTAHYAVLLDQEVTAGEAVPEGDGIIHTTETSVTLEGLTQGRHTVTVVLVDGEHVPLDPLVQDTITINIK